MPIDIRRLLDDYEDDRVVIRERPCPNADTIVSRVMEAIPERKQKIPRKIVGMAAVAAVTCFLAGCVWVVSVIRLQQVKPGDISKTELETTTELQNWEKDYSGALIEFEDAKATNLVSMTVDYLPEDDPIENYNFVTLRGELQGKGYDMTGIDLSDELLDQTYTYLCMEETGRVGPGYVIELIQSADVATRTFSLFGEVVTVKEGEFLGMEGMWLTNDPSKKTEAEATSEDAYLMSDVCHHLLLYHPTDHYVIHIAVYAERYDITELDRIAEGITVHMTDIISKPSGSMPNQSFDMTPLRG